MGWLIISSCCGNLALEIDYWIGLTKRSRALFLIKCFCGILSFSFLLAALLLTPLLEATRNELKVFTIPWRLGELNTFLQDLT